VDYAIDHEQRAQLIEQHLPLARAIAARYGRSPELREELAQVGAVGLVAAASRFDADRGVPFAAYAAATVEGEIRRYFRDRSTVVRVPRRERDAERALRMAESAASMRLGRQASPVEVADEAGIRPADADRARSARGEPLSLAEIEQRPSTAAADELERCERRALLRRGLVALPAPEREAVGLWFVGDLSQREIARRMRISQSQASRLLASALERLRRELTGAESV